MGKLNVSNQVIQQNLTPARQLYDRLTNQILCDWPKFCFDNDFWSSVIHSFRSESLRFSNRFSKAHVATPLGNLSRNSIGGHFTGKEPFTLNSENSQRFSFLSSLSRVREDQPIEDSAANRSF